MLELIRFDCRAVVFTDFHWKSVIGSVGIQVYGPRVAVQTYVRVILMFDVRSFTTASVPLLRVVDSQSDRCKRMRVEKMPYDLLQLCSSHDWQVSRRNRHARQLCPSSYSVKSQGPCRSVH